MPIQLDCTECKSEIEVSGYDDLEDGVIQVKCKNCLADIEITKKKGEVKDIKIKGKNITEGLLLGLISIYQKTLGGDNEV